MFPASIGRKFRIPELKAVIQPGVNLDLEHQPASGTTARFGITRKVGVVLPNMELRGRGQFLAEMDLQGFLLRFRPADFCRLTVRPNFTAIVRRPKPVGKIRLENFDAVRLGILADEFKDEKVAFPALEVQAKNGPDMILSRRIDPPELIGERIPKKELAGTETRPGNEMHLEVGSALRSRTDRTPAHTGIPGRTRLPPRTFHLPPAAVCVCVRIVRIPLGSPRECSQRA